MAYAQGGQGGSPAPPAGSGALNPKYTGGSLAPKSTPGMAPVKNTGPSYNPQSRIGVNFDSAITPGFRPFAGGGAGGYGGGGGMLSIQGWRTGDLTDPNNPDSPAYKQSRAATPSYANRGYGGAQIGFLPNPGGYGGGGYGGGTPSYNTMRYNPTESGGRSYMGGGGGGPRNPTPYTGSYYRDPNEGYDPGGPTEFYAQSEKGSTR
jgi:hypothetical protein